MIWMPGCGENKFALVKLAIKILTSITNISSLTFPERVDNQKIL
jgi:hypothetical protein